jgi:hypothetical protein
VVSAAVARLTVPDSSITDDAPQFEQTATAPTCAAGSSLNVPQTGHIKLVIDAVTSQ